MPSLVAIGGRKPIVAWRRGDIGSPRRPHQGKAIAKQKPVAGVCGGGRIIIGRRFVQLTENAYIAAVVDLSYKNVPLRRVTSAGRNTRNSALNSTSPRSLRGASLRSAIGPFAAASGSSAKKARPRSFS